MRRLLSPVFEGRCGVSPSGDSLEEVLTSGLWKDVQGLSRTRATNVIFANSSVNSAAGSAPSRKQDRVVAIEPRSRVRRLSRPPASFALLLAFGLSGYAALSYEMAWVRQLVMSLGVTYFAITTILVAFMAGLALGAATAGRLVDRLRLPPLLAFAGLEILLALYAQLFPWLITTVDAVYLGLSSGSGLSFTGHAMLRIAFALVVLLPPAVASGATLPVASKAFITRDDGIGGGIAALYGANLVGATLGCFVTTFFVIGLFGFPATAWIGSGANLAAATIALLLWRRTDWPACTPPDKQHVRSRPWLPGAAAVGLAYFVVGFASLGGELLWTRVLSQFGFNPATLVFGLVLTTYLVGHALGSLVLFPFAARRMEPRRLFVLLLLALSTLVAGTLWGLTLRFEVYTPIGPLRHIGLVLPWELTWLIIPGLMLPAACTGALLPLASHLTIRGTHSVGTGVGSLAALSTVGGILGAFATGFLLMPALGAVPCLLFLAGCCAVTAVWSWWALVVPRRGAGVPATISVVLVAAVGILLTVVPNHLHLILFPGERIIVFKEGLSASAAVVDADLDCPFLLVGGERVFGGGTDFPLLMALHPEATDVAIIGLGSGSVAADALSDQRLERVYAIDIDGDLPDLLPLIQVGRWDLFTAPRFIFVENDGRHFLRTVTERYDIIVNDAAIYAWYLELSTVEFNRLAASRLEPEGLYVGRLHLDRITDEAFRAEVRTFLEVFPNAAFWGIDGGSIGMLVGRNGDLPVTGPVGIDGIPPGRGLWQDTAELHAIAEDGRLIEDLHPLHVPRTFTTEDRQPIIEYTKPSYYLPPSGNLAPPRLSPSHGTRERAPRSRPIH